MDNWSDLRVFLALYREGSVNRAAPALKMSPSTVSRRLQCLEEELGAALFLRGAAGLTPTPVAEEVLALAQEAEQSALQIRAVVSDLQSEPAGVVRVALSEDLEEMVVLPALPELMARHPRLRVEFVSGTDLADLTRREADLAVRSIRPTSGEGLVVRLLRRVRVGVFCSPSYLSAYGAQGLSAQRWVGWESGRSHLGAARWLRGALPEAEVVFRGSNMNALRVAASCGLGLVMLPEIFGALTPGLVRFPWAGPALPEGELWLVGHAAQHRSARVRVVRDFLVALLSETPGRDDVLEARRRLGALYAGSRGWDQG